MSEAPPAPAALRYPQIAARVFDTPLLIEQSKLSTILRVLGPRLGFDHDELPSSMPTLAHDERLLAGASMQPIERRREGYYAAGPVAIVPVLGTLVQRSSSLDALSGLTSYGKIEYAFAAALAEPDVTEILFEIDSPGGEAAGAFDLADRIYAARGQKRMTAVATEFAASAAYLLASSADVVVLPRTGSVGSIGVVSAHYDYSGAMQKRGVAVTFIYAGEKKIDGNPYQPLSPEAKAAWQADTDTIYRLFVDTVARNRGMKPAAVRATKAGLFLGRSAVDARLADAVNTLTNELDQAVTRAGARAGTTIKEVMTMSDTTELNKAVADAVAGERARIKAIVRSSEAKGRAELAAHLAFETDIGAEPAIALLAKSPKAAANGPLAAAMEQFGTPGIRSTEAPEARKNGLDAGTIYAGMNTPPKPN